jgi:hypothetical protein
VDVMRGLRSRLPDAVVGLPGALDRLVDELADLTPQAQAQRPAGLLVERGRVSVLPSISNECEMLRAAL